jgi:hypothetical protein
MRAGNINMLVELLVWLGFLCYLKNKLVSFSALIVLSAMYNLVTMFFLVLLLFTQDKRKYQYLFVAFFSLCGILLLSYVQNPILFKSFIKNALSAVQDERGLHQPSTLTFLTDIVKLAAAQTDAMLAARIAQILYLCMAVVIAAASWHALTLASRFKDRDREKILIYLSCLVYALVLPRFKDYYYILLLVPTYHIIKKARHTGPYIFLFILVVLPSILSYENPLPGFGGLKCLLDLFWEYYPLILAYFIWGIYLHEIFASERGDGLRYALTQDQTDLHTR